MNDYVAPQLRDRKLDLREVLEDLAEDGLISPEQMEKLLTRASGGSKRHPLAVVAGCDWVDQRSTSRKLNLEYLTEWLARRCGLAYHRINPRAMDVTRTTSLIPYAYAAHANILPVKITEEEVVIATGEPYAREWERELQPILKQKITRVLANPQDIRRYLVELYTLSRSIRDSTAMFKRSAPAGLQNLEQLMELGRAGRLDANDQAVVNIVDWLLQYAFDSRASDIHLEPRRELSNVRFRIDGVLHEVYQLPSAVMHAAVSRLKILARMDLAEKRRPQDGRIKTRSPEGREVELRVSSLPTAFGEKLVMRIFDPEVLVKDFAELGFSPAEQLLWESMIQNDTGIVLVTGPTGSGKTTTLYSSLKQLATPDVNICTIEDPIELVEPSLNQMQVNAGIDLTFAAGVRSMLRQDPDIMMIGEIRDLETAEIAMQAAMTGHLVLSTMHTNDAPSAVTRLIELGVPPYLIRANLLGVVAQRLLRTLCAHCRKPAVVSESAWSEACSSFKLPMPQTYEPYGCLECRATGYRGRSGIYEIMVMSDTLRALITDRTDIVKLRKVAMRQGMHPLRYAALKKAAMGVTSLDEALKSSPPLPVHRTDDSARP